MFDLVPVWLLEWFYGLLFGLGGLSKLPAAGAEPLRKMFPRLPHWFWPLAGLWELAIAAAYMSGQAALSVGLCAVYMGGVLYSVLMLKNHQGCTVMQQVSMGMLIPVRQLLLCNSTL